MSHNHKPAVQLAIPDDVQLGVQLCGGGLAAYEELHQVRQLQCVAVLWVFWQEEPVLQHKLRVVMRTVVNESLKNFKLPCNVM